jgi:heat-inducible transcriptional repressor
VLTPRQELLLGKVVDGFAASGQPVGSKALAADPDVDCGPSTIRNELSVLEELGLLAHPHTSAGRLPTDAGYRYFVDRVLPARRTTAIVKRPPLGLSLVRREVDEAMRVTTETLSQVTNLLAIVTAPPLETTTIRHVEVLPLQPQVLMVVIITSTGGVSKRVFTFDRPIDSGLAEWAAQYLNEQLVGMGLGARMLHSRLTGPTLPPTERAFVEQLAPAFTDLASTAEDSLYVDGAARLLSEYRFQDLSQLNALMEMLERRVSLLSILSEALAERDLYVRIGAENPQPALRSLSMVAANYGLPQRNLGTVSVIGPTRMDYATAIRAVREAAVQLSRFIEDVYDES